MYKDRNLHSRTYQNRKGEHLGNNAKGLASNLVCLFKNVHVAISNKVLKLNEDRGLFPRILANSRPYMHLQECLNNYELSIGQDHCLLQMTQCCTALLRVNKWTY